jgi:hypothetical protein
VPSGDREMGGSVGSAGEFGRDANGLEESSWLTLSRSFVRSGVDLDRMSIELDFSLRADGFD